MREPLEAQVAIYIVVQEGLFGLNGRVPGLEGKRLAGVLAW